MTFIDVEKVDFCHSILKVQIKSFNFGFQIMVLYMMLESRDTVT